MSVEISKEVIQKLTDNSAEIRLRAFEHIESKFVRALGHQLTIVFEPSELCKQLIRWFKYPPSAKSNIVLELLARVLESSYGKDVVEKLGVSRLITELKKIQKILHEPKELRTIDRINGILFKQENNSTDHQTDSDLVSFVEKLSIASSDDSATKLPNCVPADFETAWSKQPVADYNSLKVISEVLTSAGATPQEKDKSLQYLRIVMLDYPAEYMLQPPHLFVNLLQLCGISQENENHLQGSVFMTLHSFLKVLRGCLYKRFKVDSYASNTRGQIGASTGTQLKISKAMELLLEKCLDQLEIQPISARKEVVLVLEIVQTIFGITKILHLYIGARFLSRTYQIKMKLLDICNQDECNMTLTRIKHIWITSMLLEMAEINDQCSQLADQYKLLIPQLVDYSLQVNYPLLFDRIKKVIFAADITIETSYKKLQKLKTEFNGAICLLKQGKINPFEIIAQSANILPILNTLKSHKLTKMMFDAILEAIPLYLTDNEVKLQASFLLHGLLQLQSANLKSYIYHRISSAVKKHFAALMNNENNYNNIQNQQLLSALIVGVPFDFNIIQKIIHDSFEEDCSEIRRNAENIVLLLLRTHHFSESAWLTFVETFSPILPILQCCTHSKPIYDLLQKLFDPDSKPFPFIDLLRGNIGLMFANDSAVRSEALTRLIYMLNSLPQTSEYVPNIIEVSDVLPNDLCMQATPSEFHQIFNVNESCYELKALLNLLNILDTPDIEPQVRKSALLQLNIMCRNWETIGEFCKEQAYCLVLSALENSLRKDSSTDNIENVVPTISILVKLLIYNSGFRHELASIPNVYVLLLRALFYFSQDAQLRLDTSICLFLLVFGSFLVVSCDTIVEAPKLISNLKVPFKCKFKSMSVSIEQSYPSNVPDMVTFFTSEIEWKKYICQVIAHSYFKEPVLSKKDVQNMRACLDICPSLLIEQHDARLIRVTNCFQNLRALLKTISNATDQKTLIKSVTTLRLQLMLYYKECSTLKHLPPEITNAIYSLLSKYLQVTPGNPADYQVYASVLDILHLCVQLSSIGITRQLKCVLRTDIHHGIMIMLKNSELSLDMYFHLTEFLIVLFSAVEDRETNAEQAFRRKLFEMVHDVIQQFYVTRNFQRIRCLLSFSKILTDNCLELSEQILHRCARSFMKLSINVRSSTQTGSQFHRDCLLNFIKIFKQLSEPLKAISESLLKHLIGLCGHHDMEVRALAWNCLSLIAYSRQPNDTNNGSHFISGTKLIASKLSYLPGGLVGSCLWTFLDAHEVALVRHFAGHLFILLLNDSCNFEEAILLIERGMFFSIAYNSLETCIFDKTFPLHSHFLEKPNDRKDGAEIELATCETIICYCRICIALIKLQPEFVIELCEKPLIFKLYEILKLPMVSSNASHYEMCSQICVLYALCSKDNFIFLQRTLCHDDRWLSCLFDLLILPSNGTEESLACVLQLVLVLCREEFVFHRLCSRLTKNADILQQLFSRAIAIPNINSTFMRCTLSVLIYLLIKSQAEEITEGDKCYFTSALEKEFDVPQNTSQTSSYDSISVTNKENISWSGNLKITTQRRKLEPAKCWNKLEVNGKLSVSELILIDLHKIFVHFYPCNTCKFDCTPSATRILTCDALSLLLKLSPRARLAANVFKLLKTILLILESFLQEFGNNGTTFIKRRGESKKLAIIKNLKILFQILLHWFCPSAGVLVDELHCFEISKVIIKIWPWLEYSLELKCLLLQVCSFLSERSLPICQQFSTMISSYSHSILQLVIKVVITETHKVKTTNVMHLSIVVVGLRVMMNCCACAEGRSLLVKEHALDVIDGLHPFNNKSPKIRQDILLHWLQFWELFSRYSEGGQARNLNSLCAVINRSTHNSKTRLICLKIMRNMCFAQQNRNTLLTSSDFINTTYEVITQPLGSNVTDTASFEEQLVISVAIWQLISGGIKFMAMLRGTKLAKKLRDLREHLLVLHEKNTTEFTNKRFAVDLINVLEIIINIFAEI